LVVLLERRLLVVSLALGQRRRPDRWVGRWRDDGREDRAVLQAVLLELSTLDLDVDRLAPGPQPRASPVGVVRVGDLLQVHDVSGRDATDLVPVAHLVLVNQPLAAWPCGDRERDRGA